MVFLLPSLRMTSHNGILSKCRDFQYTTYERYTVKERTVKSVVTVTNQPCIYRMGLASLLTCNNLHQPEHEEIAHATNGD